METPKLKVGDWVRIKPGYGLYQNHVGKIVRIITDDYDPDDIVVLLDHIKRIGFPKYRLEIITEEEAMLWKLSNE